MEILRSAQDDVRVDERSSQSIRLTESLRAGAAFVHPLAHPLSESRGKVSGALLGALVMASLDNGMSLLSVENATQYIIKGAVLVAAVGFDMAGRKKS